MLKSLFGNRTAAQVLLFFEEHEKGFANEIARALKIPLNMVQRQLERLERGSVLRKRYHNRSKIYRWNTDYPLYRELRRLLAKGRRHRDAPPSSISKDPADTTSLSLRQRIQLCTELSRVGQGLSPASHMRPFGKTFDSWRSYEAWKKRQSDPWLIS